MWNFAAEAAANVSSTPTSGQSVVAGGVVEIDEERCGDIAEARLESRVGVAITFVRDEVRAVRERLLQRDRAGIRRRRIVARRGDQQRWRRRIADRGLRRRRRRPVDCECLSGGVLQGGVRGADSDDSTHC